jgi:hypothetical protein
MAEEASKIESTVEGSQMVWANYRGTLFTTPVRISSTSAEGKEFNRDILFMRILPRFDDSGKSADFIIQATQVADDRVVEYPLKKYSDFKFDKEAGTASFVSRGQQFSITVIEDSPAVSEDPQVRTGDAENG